MVNPVNDDIIHAGVLIGVYDGAIILTKRSMNLRSFTGHVCLPGGKVDKTDESVIATAMREFCEEIYFSGNIQPLFCMLPESSLMTGQCVYPVVAILDGEVTGYNSEEVEKVMYLKVDDLKTDFFEINPNYPLIKHNRCFSYDGELIWGLTAHILYKIAQIDFIRNIIK